MNLLCKLFGHKWNLNGRFRQPCKRKWCTVYRTLMYDKIAHYFGGNSLTWRIIDLKKVKFPK